MIYTNTIRLECLQLVNVAFLGTKAHGHIRLFTPQQIKRKTTIRCLSARAPSSDNAKTGRLRREDIRHTNFDHAFSKWKTLSGPFDWEDYSLGKEGAERNRTKSLPNRPGLYEFGIPCKFSSRVIVVYVGQSQNLRARLLQYGRNGAHLEYRLFSDIFSKGHTIVYRCATMSSKRSAEEIEDELLRIYDYAWNKRCNGDRRPDDIHKNLESQATKSCFSSLVNMISRYFDQIKTHHPFVPRNIQNNASFDRVGIKGIWSMIFGISKKWFSQVGRSGSGSNEKYSLTNICDPVSAKLPVDRKKRCAERGKST